MKTFSLVYLARAANGPIVLSAFLTSYRAHPNKTPHELVFACKGFTTDAILDLTSPKGLEIKKIYLPDTGFDLGTYKRVSEELSSDYVCFVNSFSRPLINGWLDVLFEAAQLPNVGIAGATGSLEGVDYAPFPNPHVRTNAFCMRRELWLDLEHPPMMTEKSDANRFEAGANSITKQILRRGLRAVVVGSNGIYDVSESRDSGTFRWAEQRNLLVSDNRTEHYQHSTLEQQRYLRTLAWGAQQ